MNEIGERPGAPRLVIDNATTPPEPPLDDPPAVADGDANRPPRHDDSGLPDNCPIVPLGKDGATRWFIDGNKELRGIEGAKLTRLTILDLLGRGAATAQEIWGRHTGNKGTVRFDSSAAEQALLAASAKRLWSPRDRVRGRGFWVTDDQSLVVHAGGRLLRWGQWRAPGIILEGQVYPAAPELMLPALPTDQSDPFAAAREALALFGKWRWKRTVDPRLALGCWGCLVAGGALGWRPVIAVNGLTDAGKSLLFKTMALLSGGWVTLSEDTSEAGIRLALGHDALGVLIDEAEPGERTAAVERMARRATGGGRSRRGTSDQRSVESTLRSTIGLGAIERASFLAQDINRRIVLELEVPRIAPPVISAKEAAELGARMLHLIIEGWPRLASALAQFRSLLVDSGHKTRGAMVLATVLGMADIMLTGEPVDRDHAELLIEELGVDTLPDANLAIADHEAWLQHFANSLLPLDHNPTLSRRSISEWLGLAACLGADHPYRDICDRVLKQHGIVIPRPAGKEPIEFWVASRNPQLARLHKDSKWKATEGDHTGRWSVAAQNLDGAKGATAKAPLAAWGTKIPLSLIVDYDTARKAAAALLSGQRNFYEDDQ